MKILEQKIPWIVEELDSKKNALLQKYQQILIDKDEADNGRILVRGRGQDLIIIDTNYVVANYGNTRPGDFIYVTTQGAGPKDELRYFRGQLSLCVGIGQHRPSEVIEAVPWFLVEDNEGIIFWPPEDAPDFPLLKTCCIC
ncbi:MAG: hypothetical protein UT42_C0027G0002 [Candidatus Falkowbacteria bacterium GW2011_GWA2_39_24]|uniref:Uncharacterized protein n=1 Tax=Candidatus Falkowbacteria bacterium GW2011_GWA2_39_24 TaxID=1618634 RepID=A0A0G0RLE7_9BACT|nr:MAG: hypothetical protein UT42_C0027G0002 [Candidatus Falkowbacteria bacterium GW2011_GWA2_39_24]